MFQFRAFPTYTYFIQCTSMRYCRTGFPHSEIFGSKRMCRSPKLIAACHVLHRLLMPRHSPCALISLTIFLVLRRIMQVTEVLISRSNCSFYPKFHKKICLLHLSAKHPLLPCFNCFSSYLIVQFSRCRLRSKTGSKHSKHIECFDPFFDGGDNRIRTDDLLRAKQALSHLSYTPKGRNGGP